MHCFPDKISNEKKGLNFEINNSCPPETIIGIDKNRLSQVLLNLFSNAIKFTSEGFIRPTLSIIDDEDYAEERSTMSIRNPMNNSSFDNKNPIQRQKRESYWNRRFRNRDKTGGNKWTFLNFWKNRENRKFDRSWDRALPQPKYSIENE
jgi:signal transduction histidine kinase